MKVESIAEWSILQYFWPALSNNLFWNQFLVFLRVAVLHRFYCMLVLSWSSYIWAVACDFQQCGILTSVDSYEPVQPPIKLRNSKWFSVSSLTITEYSDLYLKSNMGYGSAVAQW